MVMFTIYDRVLRDCYFCLSSRFSQGFIESSLLPFLHLFLYVILLKAAKQIAKIVKSYKY